MENNDLSIPQGSSPRSRASSHADFIASSSATPSLTTGAARRRNYLLVCEGMFSATADSNKIFASTRVWRERWEKDYARTR
jgi:hypothetical protein